MDDDTGVGNLKETAEHFLINSMTMAVVIPEPSTLLLVSTGLVGVGMMRSRSRKKTAKR